MSELHLERLKALRKELPAGRAVLVSSPVGRRYFSGFEAGDTQIDESSGVLLISAKSQKLLTDSRYTEAAKKEAPLFEIVTCRQGLAAELAALEERPELVWIEPEFLTVGVLGRLKKKSKLKFAPLPFSLDAFRERKSPAEIALVKKALNITEGAIAALWRAMKPGLTEAEAALFLEVEFKRRGADGPSFETIVAAGANAAKPHAAPGPRKIREGETVVIDCGAKYKGYCADITRTKILGEAKPWQKEIYKIVREAQLAAIAEIRPGRTGREVDAAARDHIAARGYGDFFGHGLGHGVGLAIHEAPSLSPRNEKPLEPGQIVTVEPGVYLPGKGGVRLEQLVLVTENGSQVLNRNKDFYKF